MTIKEIEKEFDEKFIDWSFVDLLSDCPQKESNKQEVMQFIKEKIKEAVESCPTYPTFKEWREWRDNILKELK